VPGEELRQVLEPRGEEDGQVTPVDDLSAQRAGLLDQPAEVWVQLRRAAGDVHGGDVGHRQCVEAELHRLAGHDLGAVRPGVHVAVPAGLVAQLADVHLQHLNAGRPQWPVARVRQGLRERPVPRPLQQLDLPGRVG
jgi:hypothetical protein